MNTYTHPRPFTGDPFDDEQDPDHPSPDGQPDVPRMVLERHIHQMRVDATDEWAYVPVTAVFWPGIGEVVELGPWSLSPEDARLLAASLTTLASLVDTKHPDSLIHETEESTS
ncbi:MAG: hypothetical protein HGA44_18645 [Cellulomonadaceae bacterium]|nr:hypothetical protein [Cellulomonadaceae bacterium]